MRRYGYGLHTCCDCRGPVWGVPVSREEIVGELEDYKITLESEIVTLEKRIKALKEKAE